MIETIAVKWYSDPDDSSPPLPPLDKILTDWDSPSEIPIASKFILSIQQDAFVNIFTSSDAPISKFGCLEFNISLVVVLNVFSKLI